MLVDILLILLVAHGKQTSHYELVSTRLSKSVKRNYSEQGMMHTDARAWQARPAGRRARFCSSCYTQLRRQPIRTIHAPPTFFKG
eukprot:1580139-Pyramimonas_sp.AAC.1